MPVFNRSTPTVSVSVPVPQPVPTPTPVQPAPSQAPPPAVQSTQTGLVGDKGIKSPSPKPTHRSIVLPYAGG